MLLTIFNRPRFIFAFMGLTCMGLLSFGLYLQHVVGLEPCPMCIVQRYALALIALVATLGCIWSGQLITLAISCTLLGLSAGGAYVAARQSWLQWYPPEVVSCGRDFYGMIETFPLKTAIPMIFRGGGDCSQVDWTFLGGSIANWSFVAFIGLGLSAIVCLWAFRAVKKL